MIYRRSDSSSAGLCAGCLRNGGIAVIPTDTVYGLSGIADSVHDTGSAIRRLKGRSGEKPFIQLIESPGAIFRYTDDVLPSWLEEFWPGPLTVIVNDRRSSGTTAFRCPGDEWLRNVVALCGSPIYSTSANISGEPVLDTEAGILSVFGDRADAVVLDGDRKNSVPSTIIDVSCGEIRLVRRGAAAVPQF